MSQVPRNFYAENYYQPQPIFFTEQQVGEICFLAQSRIQELESTIGHLRQTVVNISEKVEKLQKSESSLLDRNTNLRAILFDKEKSIKDLWEDKKQLKITNDELKFEIGQTRFKIGQHYVPIATMRDKEKEWKDKVKYLTEKLERKQKESDEEISCLNEQLEAKNKYYLDKIQAMSRDLYALSEESQSKKRKVCEVVTSVPLEREQSEKGQLIDATFTLIDATKFMKEPVELRIDVNVCNVVEVQGNTEDDWFYVMNINDNDKMALSSELFRWFTEMDPTHLGIVRRVTDNNKIDVLKLKTNWQNSTRLRLCLTGKAVVDICNAIIQRYGDQCKNQIQTVLDIVPSLVWTFK